MQRGSQFYIQGAVSMATVDEIRAQKRGPKGVVRHLSPATPLFFIPSPFRPQARRQRLANKLKMGLPLIRIRHLPTGLIKHSFPSSLAGKYTHKRTHMHAHTKKVLHSPLW